MDSDRRRHLRAKMRVQLELKVEGNDISSHASTSDLSPGGFYLETMFAMPVGTNLEVTLYLDPPVRALAQVATHDPNFGNGVRFTRISPEDEGTIRAAISLCDASETVEMPLDAFSRDPLLEN